MRHVFRATRIGWDSKQDGVWFDADQYTREEAEAQFKPFQGVTQQGYPYTGYEYDGVRYHDFYYLGLYDDDGMPQNNEDFIKHILNEKH